MARHVSIFLLLIILVACLGCDGSKPAATSASRETVVIVDAMGRNVEVPRNPKHVICSSAGCLRYLVYLQEQGRAVGVDSIEKRKSKFEARPYILAHPELRKLPLFGQFRGFDDPELIAALEPQPEVIFKTYATRGANPDELQKKTGIPVVTLDYGDLGLRRDALNHAIRTMAKVLDVEKRGEEVLGYFDTLINDVKKRVGDIAPQDRPSCYVGGIAFSGPHGLCATERGYPPFHFLSANNVAAPKDGSKPARHMDISRENLLMWNPQILFVDLSTVRGGTKGNALFDLKTNPAYQSLDAIKNKKIYGVLPYNWYTSNHGNTLANTYFIGKTLYPDQFKDIDPAAKADEIYRFLVGKPVFHPMYDYFVKLVYKNITPAMVEITDKGKVLGMAN